MLMLKNLILLTRPVRYWFGNMTYATSKENVALEEFCGKFKNRPMLVIGNGPSLNKTPLDDFISIPSIGMNKIDLLFPHVKWRPTYIVCINNFVVRQHWCLMLKSNIPTLLSWNCRYFIPRSQRYQFRYFLTSLSSDFATNITKGLGSVATVTYTALQIAFYMGADPAILFGVDHSFSTTGKPCEYALRKGADIDHFAPNYFKAGTYWGLPDLKSSELGYQNAKKAFERDGRAIYDATIGGKLDIFPKISIEEAKKMCSLPEYKALEI